MDMQSECISIRQSRGRVSRSGLGVTG